MKQSSTDVETVFAKAFGRAPTAKAIAPGRIEFIGNHLDYNGGQVMGVAVDLGVTCAIAPREDTTVQLVSATMDGKIETNLGSIQPLDHESSWANYVLGVFSVLRDHGLEATAGFDLAITTTLPLGAGMSSSAAIELSSALAICNRYRYPTTPEFIARVGRTAENTFVGMPCGILDQGVSAFGAVDHLVHIDCTTETFTTIPLPQGLHFHIFNSTKKHALIDSLYAERHTECAEAFKVLAARFPHLTGLAKATREQLSAASVDLWPDQQQRARHIVEESERVEAMKSALAQSDLKRVGELLTASHHSSRDLFENSCAELNYLVDNLVAMPGVYGARLTGGGFGGAVMAIANERFTATDADALCCRYNQQFGAAPTYISCKTGAGARLLS